MQEAFAGGIDYGIIDWENRGKEQRQQGADTQINYHNLEDLKALKRSTQMPIVCRINGFGENTPMEIEAAVENGASEILLPMVRTADEVSQVLSLVDGRMGVGILVETEQAIENAKSLARLPLARVYVGLNDLAIERGENNIFLPVVDGTVEELRGIFEVSFGFGGITLPQGGNPIPAKLLMGEMTRLNCQFSFLRRSFMRDMRGKEFCVEIPRIRECLHTLFHRSADEISADREQLVEKITHQSPSLALSI